MRIETEQFVIHKMQILIDSYELTYLASDIHLFESRVKERIATEIVKQLINQLEITGTPDHHGVIYKAKVATLKNK